MARKRTFVMLAALAALAIGLGSAWVLTRPSASAKAAAQSYEFATISTGTIESTVSSSGTLSPVSQLSVLAQMSGRVEKVLVGYNDRVKKGQVLVQLNTDTLKLEQLGAEAAVRKAQAGYDLQLLDYQNKKKLSEKGLLAEYDLASSASSLAVAAAELASVQSALEVIKIKMDQYALVTSPIDGIVLDMDVEVGQTVVEGSSSNATSLFTLAEDLTRMRIAATVDELDIGSIKVGQEARFTVEADPGTAYTGTVSEIRLVPTTSNNVVAYSVMIDAANTNGKLLPGMTADITFIKEKKVDVLVVPSAALRFTPTTLTAEEIARAAYLAGLAGLTDSEKAAAVQAYDEQQSAGTQTSQTTTTTLTSLIASGPGGGLPGGGFGGPPGDRSGQNGASTASASSASGETAKYLWYMGTDGKLAALKVTTGASDSTRTEVSGADDLEGREVILKLKVE
jgi:HlyD family secretion protein